MREKIGKKYKFSDYSALHAEYNGINKLGGKEVEDWEFYINKDNIHLLNELKVNKLDPKICTRKVSFIFSFHGFINYRIQTKA